MAIITTSGSFAWKAFYAEMHLDEAFVMLNLNILANL